MEWDEHLAALGFTAGLLASLIGVCFGLVLDPRVDFQWVVTGGCLMVGMFLMTFGYGWLGHKLERY